MLRNESTDYSSAPDPPTVCSSSADPLTGPSNSTYPPSYSECVRNSNASDSGTKNRHPVKTDRISVKPISEDNASEDQPLNGVPCNGIGSALDTRPSVPLPDYITRSENRDNVHDSRLNQYTSQPAYNPSYMSDTQENGQSNRVERKTVLIHRLQDPYREDRRCAKRKTVLMFFGLLVGSSVLFLMIAYIATRPQPPSDHPMKNAMKDRDYENEDSNIPYDTVDNPILTDQYKDIFGIPQDKKINDNGISKPAVDSSGIPEFSDWFKVNN